MVQTIGSIPFGTQLDWLWAELQGPEKKTWQNFLTNPNLITPQEFATAFEKTYERADGKHLEKRQNYAKDVYNAFSNNNLSTISPNAVTAVNYLTDKGMTLAQAAGVTGNLMAESGFDINPDAYNPSGGGIGAYGIAQWRDDRQKGLQDYYSRMQPQQTQKENTMVQQPNNLLSMLQGGLSSFMKPQDENQLYSRGERFAMALDPLIHPNFRAGKQIAENAKAQKAFELQAGARTRTVAVLRQLAESGDEVAASVLGALEAKALEPKDAMTIYYRQKFAKPTKTAIQKSGAELNAELKAKGQPEIYDEKQAYNVFSTGDVKPIQSGPLVSLGGEESAADKKMGEEMVKRYFQIVDEGQTAVDAYGKIGMLRTLMLDPNFTSGAFAESKMNLAKVYAALGGDVSNLEGVASKEAFDALSKDLILAKMGGSLGAGFSEGDRDFVEKQVPQLGTTKEGNFRILLINEIIQERKIALMNLANEYAAKQRKEGKPPIDIAFFNAMAEFGRENSLEEEFKRRLSEIDQYFD